ncbi:MAG: 30S ribosomal protein S24e [Candidatus Bathyarchaeia archaeon]
MTSTPTYEYSITKDNFNPLLERRELNFEIYHPNAPTPTRKEVKEKLAAIINTDQSTIHIAKMETKRDSWATKGLVYIYLSQNKAKLLTPHYLIERETRKGKPKETGENSQPKETAEKRETSKVKEEKTKPPTR